MIMIPAGPTALSNDDIQALIDPALVFALCLPGDEPLYVDVNVANNTTAALVEAKLDQKRIPYGRRKEQSNGV